MLPIFLCLILCSIRTTYAHVEIAGSSYVLQGEPITLRCITSGGNGPSDNVDWFKGGDMVTPDNRLVLTKTTSDNSVISTLFILQSVRSDEGNYICRDPMGDITAKYVNILSGPPRCQRNGTFYQPGETFMDGCNSCRCGPFGGIPHCSYVPCQPNSVVFRNCTVNGNTYTHGEVYENNCSMCECVNGQSICTDNACSKKPVVQSSV